MTRDDHSLGRADRDRLVLLVVMRYVAKCVHEVAIHKHALTKLSNPAFVAQINIQTR